ncbi:MAG: arsenite methyltransferase [candidate division Zixibacteria bacterium]|nr:arsenite methyltransferase [candidate division Zixibacteria bacterium]
MERIDMEGVRGTVREAYGKIAVSDRPDCGCSPSCCGGGTTIASEDIAVGVGYSPDEVTSVPNGANMGLGCGNPQALASLRPGETVLDLGSGGGFDCFLAAQTVGPQGRVIGVDMTPEMVAKARRNAAKTEWEQVEFRLGEIEHLPVADASVDVVISKCVINLSPEKPKVFREVFRVLNPGGRIAIADMVATTGIPEPLRHDVALYTGCMSGAATAAEIHDALGHAGFEDIRIEPRNPSEGVSGSPRIEDYVISMYIQAVKPLR